MGSKNAFLEKQNSIKIACVEAGIQCGKQQIVDYLTIALRDPDIVGKNTFGRERIFKLIAKLEALDREFGKAYTLDPEADYYQEKLDRHLREVYGDELVPFVERQPDILQPGYKKARKGWK